MKKLMVMAAVAVAAVCANAATIAWGNPTTATIKELDGTTAYTIADSKAYVLSAYLMSGDTVLKSLVSVPASETSQGSAIVMTPGVLNGASLVYTYGEELSYGDPLKVILTMTKDSKQYEMVIDDQAWTVTQQSDSDSKQSLIWDTTKTYGGLAGTTTAGDYAWTLKAVPEPTSGLLLLLGVGALALRRRRA